jgi:hypothetical protein
MNFRCLMEITASIINAFFKLAQNSAAPMVRSIKLPGFAEPDDYIILKGYGPCPERRRGVRTCYPSEDSLYCAKDTIYNTNTNIITKQHVIHRRLS